MPSTGRFPGLFGLGRTKRRAADGAPVTTVLLTGAAGVVGRPLLRRLAADADIEPVCLVRATRPEEGLGEVVVGDITRPYLGLGFDTWKRLAARVDVVIHAAASVDFNADDRHLHDSNVLGTREVVAFAEAAGARLVHVSTAFVNTGAGTTGVARGVRYAATKREGEAIVKASGLPHVIVRPSIVIGDSETGEIASFQGLYKVLALFFSSSLPVLPLRAEGPLDVIPTDTVADAIMTLLRHPRQAGEFWVTSGSRAITIADAVQIGLRVAGESQLAVPAPRYAPTGSPLLRQARHLPQRVRSTLDWFGDYFLAYLDLDAPLPCSAEDLSALGAGPWPDPARSFELSMRYWAHCTGVTTTVDLREAQGVVGGRP